MEPRIAKVSGTPLLRAYYLICLQKLKEIGHATCSGRAKIPDQSACNDCGDDFHDLPSIIAADAVFRSPVGLKPYRRSVRAGTICDS
jgi:hypothetical protein